MCYSVLIKKRQSLGVLERIKDPVSLGNSAAECWTGADLKSLN